MALAIVRRLLKQEWASQFLRFCMVGLLGVALNYLTFFVFLHVLKAHYLLASGAGFILPLFVLFFLNKRFTFKIRGNGTGMLIKYFLVCTFSLFLDQLSMLVQVEILHVNSSLAKLFAMAVTTVSNFVGSRLFAFR